MKDPFAKKIEQFHNYAKKRRNQAVLPIHTYGPCCCNGSGVASDGFRILASPRIPCETKCIDAVCNYMRTADRHVNDPDVVRFPAAALRSLKKPGDKAARLNWVRIGDRAFNATLLAGIASGLPGKEVRAKFYRGEGEVESSGFVAIGGRDWVAAQISSTDTKIPAHLEDVDFRTLVVPPKKERISGVAKLERKMQKAAAFSKKMGRDGNGFSVPCACNGYRALTLAGHSVFAVRDEGFTEPTSTEGACRDVCAHVEGMRSFLDRTGKPASFRKLRGFIGKKRESVAIEGTPFDSQLLARTVEDLEADRIYMAEDGRTVVVGAEDGSWIAKAGMWGTPPVRSATIQDLLGYGR